MNILWFEVTTPSRYNDDGLVICGWQDSLERIVRTCPEIKLTIAFEGNQSCSERKNIDGVEYIPMVLQYSNFDKKLRNRWSWEPNATLLESEMQKVVQEIRPDLIQVFGTEWPLGRIAKLTSVPVVIHIMGAIVPYNNMLFPPMYNFFDFIRYKWWNPKRVINAILAIKKERSRESCERQVWSVVRYYMGRTEWDKNLSMVMHPGRKYYHVEEALRPDFINSSKEWQVPTSSKIRLITTGCGGFRKGPDMLLKTAKILKTLRVDFEWIVVGGMGKEMRHSVEKKEHTSFAENNVKIIGPTLPEKLSEMLCNSTIYVHTAYMENSPNSICEAQCLGVPVISTNVGGIASLVKDREHGVLVPADDPWQMAAAIINLASDKDLLIKYSSASKLFARKRHNPESIKKQLIDCYNNLL